MSEWDTANRFIVGVIADDLAIMLWQKRLTKADALNLAAWLVVLADDADEFPAYLAAVKNT